MICVSSILSIVKTNKKGKIIMEKSLVIVADFINEIVDERGAFGVHNAQRVKDNKTIQKANQLIAWARKMIFRSLM